MILDLLKFSGVLIGTYVAVGSVFFLMAVYTSPKGED